MTGCPVVRLSGCPVVRLSGCPVVRLSGCPVVRLSGCPVVRCPVSCDQRLVCGVRGVQGVWCRVSGVRRLASVVWRPPSGVQFPQHTTSSIDLNFIKTGASPNKHQKHSASSAKTLSKYSCIKYRKGHLLRNFIKQTTLSTCLMACSLRSLARFTRLSDNGASCGHRKSSVEDVVCFLCQSRGGCMDHFLFASRVLI